MNTISEQSAMHVTRVAIARWCSALSCVEAQAHGLAPAAESPSPQAQWHAKAASEFCAWLDAGGFSQPQEAVHPNCGHGHTQASCSHSD